MKYIFHTDAVPTNRIDWARDARPAKGTRRSGELRNGSLAKFFSLIVVKKIIKIKFTCPFADCFQRMQMCKCFFNMRLD